MSPGSNSSSMAIHVPKETPKVEMPSASVVRLREEYGYSAEAGSAEEEAQGLSEHIRAIDRELEALSAERGKLAKACLQSVDLSHEATLRAALIAKNDYRDPEKGSGTSERCSGS